MQVAAILLALLLIPVAVAMARSGSSQSAVLDPATVMEEFAVIEDRAQVGQVILANDGRAAIALFGGMCTAFGVVFAFGDRVVARIADQRTLAELRFNGTSVILQFFDVTMPKLEIEIEEVALRRFVEALDLDALRGPRGLHGEDRP